MQFQSAPLLRGAITRYPAAWLPKQFQSAPLLRGAIAACFDAVLASVVSIRAPLARGDARRKVRLATSTSFNPRPSCEGRSADNTNRRTPMMFQSAPLLRGAMECEEPIKGVIVVSIRAPLARGDDGSVANIPASDVSIRAPLARGDENARRRAWVRRCFNPRPSCEGRS